MIRELVELSVLTRIPFEHLESLDHAVLATYWDVLQEQARNQG